MRDADVPRLEAGNYYREPNNQSYWGDHPGFTMFRVLNRLSGAQTLVHTCVVPLPDAMANLRSTYTDESVFPPWGAFGDRTGRLVGQASGSATRP